MPQPRGTDARITERRLRALKLRQAGLSYRQIGDALGVSATIACRDVQREIHQIAAHSSETAAEILALELERLDALQLSIWGDATKGSLGAIDRVLRIMERRARLLGLDAPARQDLAITAFDVVIGGEPDTRTE